MSTPYFWWSERLEAQEFEDVEQAVVPQHHDGGAGHSLDCLQDELDNFVEVPEDWLALFGTYFLPVFC